MKKNSKLLIALALVLSTLFSLCSCSIDDILGKMPWRANDDTDPKILWQNATYTENCEFGKGAKTVTVKVEVINTPTFKVIDRVILEFFLRLSHLRNRLSRRRHLRQTQP